MTRGRAPRDNLGDLAEITRLINSQRIQEAHALLAEIEADHAHAAWNKPITIAVLRDRIKKATP